VVESNKVTVYVKAKVYRYRLSVRAFYGNIEITGVEVKVYKGTAVVASGTTPFEKYLPVGDYSVWIDDTVCKAELGGCFIFKAWTDGVPSNPRTIRLNKDTSLVAKYEFPIEKVTLTVKAQKYTRWGELVDFSGVPVTVTDYQTGRTLCSGSTPLTCEIPRYKKIKVEVPKTYLGYTFSDWEDGSMTLPRVLSMTASKEIIARYAP